MNRLATPVPPTHLLLIDQDVSDPSCLAKGLREVGYEVSVALCVTEAEFILTAGTVPDLVILDLNLPHADGPRFARWMQTRGPLAFVMLSAASDSASVQAATTLGALAYMVKPLRVAQMVPTIEAALSRARELRQLHTTGAQLQYALDTERDISLATGITMVQHRLGRDQAYTMLRATSRAQRRKLSELAIDVIQASESQFSQH